MSWVLFVWLGSSTPAVVPGHGSGAKCIAFAEKIQSPYYDNNRKKFQCIKVEK